MKIDIYNVGKKLYIEERPSEEHFYILIKNIPFSRKNLN